MRTDNDEKQGSKGAGCVQVKTQAASASIRIADLEQCPHRFTLLAELEQDRADNEGDNRGGQAQKIGAKVIPQPECAVISDKRLKRVDRRGK